MTLVEKVTELRDEICLEHKLRDKELDRVRKEQIEATESGNSDRCIEATRKLQKTDGDVMILERICRELGIMTSELSTVER